MSGIVEIIESTQFLSFRQQRRSTVRAPSGSPEALLGLFRYDGRYDGFLPFSIGNRRVIFDSDKSPGRMVVSARELYPVGGCPSRGLHIRYRPHLSCSFICPSAHFQWEVELPDGAICHSDQCPGNPGQPIK